jgi:membrane associated rhomboid family serine protease
LLDNNEFAQRDRLRLLVLEAKKIPFVHLPKTGRIFVPPLLQAIAAAEITAFESERDIRVPLPEGRDNWLGVMALLCLLLFWDALRHSAAIGWHLYFLPADAAIWVKLGGLKAHALASGEWWRVFTALTLHGDAAHVLGNCLFGALFLLPLCRRLGLGAGFFLAIWGGALGNMFNILFQGPTVTSLGFSSAVFAALGALCAVAARDRFRRQSWSKPDTRPLFASLAAGVAFLAFLGGSGEPGIDFSAHVLGFFGGLALVWPLCNLLPPMRGRPDLSKQLVLLFWAVGLPVLSWYLAFTN